MKVPELVMAPDWPELEEGWRHDLTQAPTVRLFWPVPVLPEEMGWLPTAVTLDGEPSGQYFLEVDASFYPDGVSLYGVLLDAAGAHPQTFIPYAQLAYLIAESNSSVRGSADPPARLTLYRTAEPSCHRHRAYLGLRDASDTDQGSDDSWDDVPF